MHKPQARETLACGVYGAYFAVVFSFMLNSFARGASDPPAASTDSRKVLDFMMSTRFWLSHRSLTLAMALAASLTASSDGLAQNFVCPQIEQRTLFVRLPSGTSREIRLRIVASEPQFNDADFRFCMSFDAQNCGYMRTLIAATPPARPLGATRTHLHSLITAMFNRAGLNEAQRALRGQLITLAELDK